MGGWAEGGRRARVHEGQKRKCENENENTSPRSKEVQKANVRKTNTPRPPSPLHSHLEGSLQLEENDLGVRQRWGKELCC